MKILIVVSLLVSVLFGVVDLNNATKKELSSLNGIGAIKAEAIIAYREANCFKAINDLMSIKGIGKKTIDKNRDNLSVGACKK